VFLRASVSLWLATVIVWTSAAASAQNWPQFRGPTGQGHSTETGLPLDWSETRHIVWKVPVAGIGWSSPVVADGRVWLTAAVETGNPARGPVDASLRVLAFDVADGREVVNVEVFRNRSAGYVNPKSNRASPTPVLDGGRVYVHFGAEGTAALASDGTVLWRARYQFESQHGAVGGSPIVYGDLLIFNCDGNDIDAFVVALDKNTGRQRWRTNRRKPSDQAYTTPLVIRVAEQDQLVSIGAYRAAAYDPATGREIWRVSYRDGFSNVPRPVFGHGLVYIATGFQEPTLIAVRPDGQGDVTDSHVAWTVTRGAPYTPTPILVGDDLYMVSDIGVLTVLDARTGTVVTQGRLPGNYSASPVFVDGRIYFQSEEGVTTVVAPGRQLQRLATNRIDGSTLASLAVSDRSFYLRSDTHLYRIAQR
jgi:outer membrane protein assembly factor BamB